MEIGADCVEFITEIGLVTSKLYLFGAQVVDLIGHIRNAGDRVDNLLALDGETLGGLLQNGFLVDASALCGRLWLGGGGRGLEWWGAATNLGVEFQEADVD